MIQRSSPCLVNYKEPHRTIRVLTNLDTPDSATYDSATYDSATILLHTTLSPFCYSWLIRSHTEPQRIDARSSADRFPIQRSDSCHTAPVGNSQLNSSHRVPVRYNSQANEEPSTIRICSPETSRWQRIHFYDIYWLIPRYSDITE